MPENTEYSVLEGIVNYAVLNGKKFYHGMHG